MYDFFRTEWKHLIFMITSNFDDLKKQVLFPSGLKLSKFRSVIWYDEIISFVG